MEDKIMKEIIEEAVKLWTDYPRLSYIEAIEMARSILDKEKRL